MKEQNRLDVRKYSFSQKVFLLPESILTPRKYSFSQKVFFPRKYSFPESILSQKVFFLPESILSPRGPLMNLINYLLTSRITWLCPVAVDCKLLLCSRAEYASRDTFLIRVPVLNVES